jgi:hypothetical protein
MSKLWCPQCEEWEERDLSIFQFFSPRCEVCNAELEEEEQFEPYEVDFKEADISYKFGDDEIDTENDAEMSGDKTDTESDSEMDVETDAETEGESD